MLFFKSLQNKMIEDHVTIFDTSSTIEYIKRQMFLYKFRTN